MNKIKEIIKKYELNDFWTIIHIILIIIFIVECFILMFLQGALV